MTRCLSTCLLCLLCFSLPALGQTYDPYDETLTAFRLTTADENSFGIDGKMSPFWNAWDKTNTRTRVAMDYIDMTTTRNAWNLGAQFSDTNDARLTVRAAYGARGLFLLFGVRDDQLAQPQYARACDIIDIFLDTMSSDQIWECGGNCTNGFFGLFGFSSIEYLIPAGSARSPINCMSFWSLDSPAAGVLVDLVTYSPPYYWSEALVPWSSVGGDRGLPGLRPQGKRIALSGGYNDFDDGDPRVMAGAMLRWREKDPVERCLDMDPPHDFCICWGDIVLGPSVPTTSASPVKSAALAIARSERPDEGFTLRGQRVRTGRAKGALAALVGPAARPVLRITQPGP